METVNGSPYLNGIEMKYDDLWIPLGRDRCSVFRDL